MPDIDIAGFDAVTFDIRSQDQFIAGIGVPLLHYKAMICPVGGQDVSDGRSTHDEHPGCSNGYIYEYAGTVIGSLQQMGATTSLTDVGLLDGSTVQVTFERFYDDKPNTQVYVQLYDRFYIKDLVVLVPNTQKVEAHITGLDRFTYKLEKVESIIDENSVRYSPSDYIIQDGKLQWVGDHRPGYDPKLNRGIIYSIRYLYTPFLYVSRLMHEVRIANKRDFKTGKMTANRAPYQAMLSREYYLYKEDKGNSTLTKEDTRRDLPSPRDGMWGPR
jgi:hypothetical protein